LLTLGCVFNLFCGLRSADCHLATLLPFLGLRLGLARTPLDLVRPVGRRHLAALNVLCMTRLKCFALANGLIGLYALLAKPNDFFFAALTRLDDVGLFRVTGSPLRLVARHSALINATALLVIESHYFRCLAVFLATFFGWLECCLPFLVSARFLRLVAAYSFEDSDLIAFSGKYRSPVAFFP